MNICLLIQNNIVPLHVASKWGRANMITLLLDNGADIEFMTRVSLFRLLIIQAMEAIHVYNKSLKLYLNYISL